MCQFPQNGFSTPVSPGVVFLILHPKETIPIMKKKKPKKPYLHENVFHVKSSQNVWATKMLNSKIRIMDYVIILK